MHPVDVSPRGVRALRAVLVSFGALALLFTGTFPPVGNPNELSRYQTVIAAVERGTFEISEELKTLGDHEDKAVSGGRTYSNKAPGLAFAAIPVYRLLRMFLPEPAGSAAAILIVLRILTVSAVCLWALARFGRRVARENPDAAPLVVYAVAFGTPFLFYARSFFSHAWSAALLFLAWDFILVAEHRGSGRRAAGAFLAAGLLAGLAGISEYPVLLIGGLLAIRSTAVGRIRGFALFAAGLAVPLAALAVYDTICFGAPWILSSSREAYPEYRELASGGLFGFHAPSVRIAIAYLFHPARGVLLFSPFLLWGVAGFWFWWRSGTGRADFLFCFASTLLFFVAMTAYPNWHGGWSLGSRYLLPVIFFAAMPAARALGSPLSRGLFLAAVVFSAASHFFLTSTFPHFPDYISFPAATGSWWFLQHGWIAPSVFGSTLTAGLAALALAAAAFSAPLVLGVRAAAPLSPRPSVCALLGVAPLVGLLLRPPELSYQARLWRAIALGRYSFLDPERRALEAEALSARTPEERHLAAVAWRLFGPRPPHP